jgi:hypothetical protein
MLNICIIIYVYTLCVPRAMLCDLHLPFCFGQMISDAVV